MLKTMLAFLFDEAPAAARCQPGWACAGDMYLLHDLQQRNAGVRHACLRLSAAFCMLGGVCNAACLYCDIMKAVLSAKQDLQ